MNVKFQDDYVFIYIVKMKFYILLLKIIMKKIFLIFFTAIS